MVNKLGVIRIIELLIAITLISIVMLVAYRQNISNQNIQDLSEIARQTLSEISSKEDLREEIVTNQKNVNAMVQTLNFINDTIPDYISFELRSCTISNSCGQSSYVGDVFSAERIISASKSNFGPIKLRLFLWVQNK